MAKFVRHNYSIGIYLFVCPGCKTRHSVWTVDEKDYPHPVWKFNNDVDKPTVHPSLLVRWNHGEKQFICHSFITSGRIQFLSDCTHNLKGQTVELPDVAVE